MFNVETDPRSKTVHGIHDRSEHTIFDAWIHDGRRQGYGTHNHVNIDTTMRFFQCGSKDPRRCNHLLPTQFGGDETFRITALGLQIAFSREIETEFIRSAVLRLYVGDYPVHILSAQLFAQPPPFVERIKHPDPAHSGLLLWIDLEDASIAISPRQPFYCELDMKASLRNMLQTMPHRSHAFGMVKVLLKGSHTREVFEDELSDADRAELAQQHEAAMLAAREEQEAAIKQHEEGQQLHHEQTAFLLNLICPAGADFEPEHIAEVQQIQHDIEMTKYAIGGGGHPGGVPPFESFDFGVVDELVVGKHERGFVPPPVPEAMLDWEKLEKEAWCIATRRLLDGRPLDESYRQEVAAAMGIENFKSA
jgi:hypothetical protein